MKCKVNVCATLLSDTLDFIQEWHAMGNELNDDMIEYFIKEGYHAARKGNVVRLSNEYCTLTYLVNFTTNARVEEILSKACFNNDTFYRYYDVIKRCATFQADMIVNRINRRGL